MMQTAWQNGPQSMSSRGSMWVYIPIRVDHQNSIDSNGFETYLIQNAISFQAFHPGPDRFFVLGLPTGGRTSDINANDVRIDIIFLLQEEPPLGCIRNWSRCAIKIIIFPLSHVSLRRTRLEKWASSTWRRSTWTSTSASRKITPRATTSNFDKKLIWSNKISQVHVAELLQTHRHWSKGKMGLLWLY